MLHLTAMGTGDPATRTFRVLCPVPGPDGERGAWTTVGGFTIALSDVPALIAELVEWTEGEG
jgi:hypothetical protein